VSCFLCHVLVISQHHCSLFTVYLFISWHATVCRPAMVMVRVVRPYVCLFICHMQISPKLGEIDVWLLGNRLPDSSPAIDSRSQVRLHHFCVSGLTLRTFGQKLAGWASECHVWICGSSHQSAPHWAPWRASCRHVP